MTDLHEAAHRALLRNLRRGTAPVETGLKEYVYICPAQGIYPHQWLWDSCFHAIVMARFDGELAKAELRTLLAAARPNGMVPQVISWAFLGRSTVWGRLQTWLYDRSHFANLTQPPVLAIALEEVHKHTEDAEFLQEALPAVKKYYESLAATRDPDGDGLLSIILPIESGMDHSPCFDAALNLTDSSAIAHQLKSLLLTVRYTRASWDIEQILKADRFSVEDLAFNCIYALGLRALSRLCEASGDEDAACYLQMALRTEAALVERCYDEETGLFYGLSTQQEIPLRVPTVASLLPLALPSLPEEVANTMLERHLMDEQSFWPEYPIPSVSLAHPRFSPDSDPLRQRQGFRSWLKNQFNKHHLIWRGPTWVNTNWFLARGLRARGCDDIADRIAEKTAAMVRAVGFWEYYNPFTGAGQGAEHFGWSTLVVDMLEDIRNPAVAVRARQFSSEVEPIASVPSAVLSAQALPQS